MSEEIINIRISKAAKEFNVGTSTIVEFLAKKGFNIDPSPNSKLTAEQYALVVKEYQGEKEVKKNADQLGNLTFKGKTITVETTEKPNTVEEEEAHTISIKTTIIHEKEEIENPQKAAPNAKKNNLSSKQLQNLVMRNRLRKTRLLQHPSSNLKRRK